MRESERLATSRAVDNQKERERERKEQKERDREREARLTCSISGNERDPILAKACKHETHETHARTKK